MPKSKIVKILKTLANCPYAKLPADAKEYVVPPPPKVSTAEFKVVEAKPKKIPGKRKLLVGKDKSVKRLVPIFLPARVEAEFASASIIQKNGKMGRMVFRYVKTRPPLQQCPGCSNIVELGQDICGFCSAPLVVNVK